MNNFNYYLIFISVFGTLGDILCSQTKYFSRLPRSSRFTKELTLKALEQAIGRENLGNGLIFHSDRESQYAAYAYQEVLGKYCIRQSMRRKGNCYDNVCMESFFSTLKKDIIYGRRFKTREEAKLVIIEYIETFYNCHRFHSTLGSMSPREHEHQYSYQEEIA